MTAKTANGSVADDPLHAAAAVIGRDLFSRRIVLVFDARTQALRHASAEAIGLLELAEDALSGSSFPQLCAADGRDIADLWCSLAAGGSAEWEGP
jgi:hypothetical protein